jgi:hypothetical protein
MVLVMMRRSLNPRRLREEYRDSPRRRRQEARETDRPDRGGSFGLSLNSGIQLPTFYVLTYEEPATARGRCFIGLS